MTLPNIAKTYRVSRVIRADETPFDSLGEQWANGIADQIEDGIVIGNMLNYQVQIIDEGSKININTVDATTITNLMNNNDLLASNLHLR